MGRRIATMAMGVMLAGAAAAVLTITASATGLPDAGSFTASDFAWTAAGGGNSVNIAPGGTVSFSYPSGTTEHNVDFGSGPQPSSCAVGTTPQAPPVPSVPTAPGWTVSCTFDTPGTYTFHCDRHTFMTGTIYVGVQATTTGTETVVTTTSTTTPTMTMPMTTTMPITTTMPTTTTGTATTPLLTPIVGSQRTAIRFGNRGGARLSGVLEIAQAGLGGEATIMVLASKASVSGPPHDHRPIAIGHLRIRNLRAGSVPFTLELAPAVRRVLLVRKALNIHVRVTISAAGARTVMVTRTLRLHR